MSSKCVLSALVVTLVFVLTPPAHGQCVAPDPPVDDPTCPPEGCDTGCGAKPRYASFHVQGPGVLQAVRVTFASLPGHEYAEGRKMWVQEPRQISEAPGTANPEPPPTMRAGSLGCDPYCTDWTQYEVVDVFNDALVKYGTYAVQVINCDDPLDQEECYSDPLLVTLSEIGDVCGFRTAPSPPAPPNCLCDFNDITIILDKWRNLPGAIRKARADLINSSGLTLTPDHKISMDDVSAAVDCFRGLPRQGSSPPAADPCASG